MLHVCRNELQLVVCDTVDDPSYGHHFNAVHAPKNIIVRSVMALQRKRRNYALT